MMDVFDIMEMATGVSLDDMHDNINDLLEMKYQREVMDQVYKPYQMDSVNGKYILMKALNMWKFGEIFDSSDGYIHGVWHPSEKRCVLFTDDEWFMPFDKFQNKIKNILHDSWKNK